DEREALRLGEALDDLAALLAAGAAEQLLQDPPRLPAPQRRDRDAANALAGQDVAVVREPGRIDLVAERAEVWSRLELLVAPPLFEDLGAPLGCDARDDL